MKHNENDPATALAEVRAALRAGCRTPPVIEMSRDPREAVAYALAVIRADDTIGKREALDQLANRIDQYIGGDTDEALSELAATMPLLEAMFVRYAMQASQTTSIDYKQKLTKLALQCQTNLARSLALLAGLKSQRNGQGRIIVHDEP